MGTVRLPVLPDFNPADHFRTGGAAPDGVRIGFIGQNFRRLMARQEPALPAREVRRHQLTRPRRDPQILDILGEHAVTSLGTIWQLLIQQPNRETGDLLTNGYANIFEIQDDDGNFWSANCYWYADYGGWRLHAYPATGPRRWGAGFQVFSR